MTIIIIIIPDTNVPKIEPDVIPRDNEKGTWNMSVTDVTISEDRSRIKKRGENF